MPATAYFAGKAGQVVITTVLQLALLLAVATTAYDVGLPSDAGRWSTFVWVTVLGALAGTVLGVAVSGVGSTRAVINGVAGFAVVLQFFSGVFFVFAELPGWMQQVAALLPLKWMTQGMRSVFLPEEAAAAEVAGSWEHGMTAVVLVAWVIIGVVLCVRVFRWRRGV